MKLILIGAAMASLTASQLAAAPQCGNRNAILEQLADKYGEARYGAGLAGTGEATTVIELFVNLETGTWTALATSANGTACLVADGNDWQLIDGDTPPNI